VIVTSGSMGKIIIPIPEMIKYTKKNGKTLYLVFILFFFIYNIYLRLFLEFSKQKICNSTYQKSEASFISY